MLSPILFSKKCEKKCFQYELKIKQTLEWCYMLNKQIAENESVPASTVMVENQVNIWHLLKRGPILGLKGQAVGAK